MNGQHDLDAIPVAEREYPLYLARVFLFFEVPQNDPARAKLPPSFPTTYSFRHLIDDSYHAEQFEHIVLQGLYHPAHLFCGQIRIETLRPEKTLELCRNIAAHFGILDFTRIGWRDDKFDVWRGFHPENQPCCYAQLCFPGETLRNDPSLIHKANQAGQPEGEPRVFWAIAP